MAQGQRCPQGWQIGGPRLLLVPRSLESIHKSCPALFPRAPSPTKEDPRPGGAAPPLCGCLHVYFNQTNLAVNSSEASQDGSAGGRAVCAGRVREVLCPKLRLPGVPAPKDSVLFTYQEQAKEMLPGQSQLSWTNISLLRFQWHWVWMTTIVNVPLTTSVHTIFCLLRCMGSSREGMDGFLFTAIIRTSYGI